MMNNYKYLIFLFIYLAGNNCSLWGQKILNLSGTIYDKNTGEVLVGAIIIEKSTHNYAVSNNYGYYNLLVHYNDTVNIKVSYTGYKSLQLKIKSTRTAQLQDFYLESGIDLGEITVNAQKYNTNVSGNEISILKLNMKQIKSLPVLFGEFDIIKALQLMPGIQSGGEGSNNLYVRGGSPDQNLILLDDVPLYYISHFGGFYSIFNPDAINNVKMIKGGFPACYGSRLSSVLDIHLKEGNNLKFSGNFTFGVLSSKLTFEGPIVKNKMSYLLSFRKNILPVFKLVGEGISYNFYDFNGKINYILSDKNRLFFSVYSGYDKIGIKNNIKTSSLNQKDYKKVKWGNILGSFRWNHIYNNSLFSNITLYNTYYSYSNRFEYLYQKNNDYFSVYELLKSGINDLSVKIDYSWFPLKVVNIKFGGQSIYHTFIPNDKLLQKKENNMKDIDSNYNSLLNSFENALFFETKLNFNHIKANLGLRFSSYNTNNSNYFSTEPRILFNYIIKQNFSIKYSYSIMNQYVHLLTYSGLGMPSDFWMPTTKLVPPEYSQQHTIGLFSSLFAGKIETSIEAYYKKMNNLITFTPGKSFSFYLDNWEKIIEKNGEGASYGIELLINKPDGKLTGWLGVTLSKSERLFANVNNNIAYPFKYDRLLDIGAVLNYYFSKKMTFSLTWTYGTGYPITLSSEKFIAENKEIYVFKEKNSYRMKDYHRMDIAVNFYKKLKKGERVWNISIFNLYNRKNPYYYYYDREYETYVVKDGSGYKTESVPGPLKIYQKSLFSFFPSFSYSYSF